MYRDLDLRSILSLPLALAALLALPAAGCGDDGSDPVPGACQAACQIDSADVCYMQATQCKVDCASLGSDAQKKGFKPNECATCQILQVGYSRSPDGTKCWGVITPTDFANAQCKDVCFDPYI